jgi:dUTPase
MRTQEAKYKPKIKFSCIRNNARVPKSRRKNDAVFDLTAHKSFILHVDEVKIVPTGLELELPQGFCGILESKVGSSPNTKIINSGYTKEIFITLQNTHIMNKIIKVEFQEKIAQMTVVPPWMGSLIEVNCSAKRPSIQRLSKRNIIKQNLYKRYEDTLFVVIPKGSYTPNHF